MSNLNKGELRLAFVEANLLSVKSFFLINLNLTIFESINQSSIIGFCPGKPSLGEFIIHQTLLNFIIDQQSLIIEIKSNCEGDD